MLRVSARGSRHSTHVYGLMIHGCRGERSKRPLPALRGWRLKDEIPVGTRRDYSREVESGEGHSQALEGA